MTVSQLISAAHVTMLTFFKKMRIVRELLPFSEPVSYRFRALERKYCVTSCLFYKFERLFPDLFREEHSAFLISGEKENVDTAELNTNRVKQWIWTLFLLAKDRALSCGHELITAFHLLLCACDHVIMSVPSFTLQSPFADTVVGRSSLEQPHTILEILAGQTNTTLEEILRVHVTYWQPFVCSVPHADVASLAQLYQKHYRRHGDFEETQFLEHNPLLMPKPSPPSPAGDAAAAQGALPPTPVRAALNTLQQLRSILAKSPTNPSEQLLAFFRNCSIDTGELIQCRARQMQEQFVNKFLTALPAVSGSSSLFEQTARQRYTVASSLYYRVMESMLRTEQERLATSDLTPLLCSDSFHRSLLACSVEVVLTVYGATSGALLGEHDLASEFSFPWVLDVFDLKPFHFVKVLESFIKAEPKLTSDVVKHLQNVENSILEQLAWQENSPVFDLLTHWAATSTSPLHQGDYPTQLFRSPIRPPGGTHLSPVSPSRRAGHSYSLALFLNKVCRLAHSRLQAMCKYLDIPTDVVQKIWTCLEHVVTQKSDLLRDRHLDQMMMCSVYAICKVLCEREVKFKTIVSAYGRMPHTSQGVYRKVVITGSSTHSIITFYNTIFMQAMKNHILQYSTTRGQPASPGSGNGEKVTVSPHTPSQRLLASPMYS
ncbi:PREDICTED: retinoblastoma-associated protein-like [Priapulus caudatus]|uniref:Retinoblastoma-associated protein-like n=1 Tax=Priapulus caudatus TaxID=37621 RepID=A0ABM1DZC4_PRICU|nr:PREDICTED: retinoblastoma-associated protein-like [Priapulus caudatus]